MTQDLAEGREGASRRSLEIYNRSIALSQPFTEHNTIWSFLKWIRARFHSGSGPASAADFRASLQMPYFTRSVLDTSKPTQMQYAQQLQTMKWGVGVVVSNQRINHDNTK